jgi:uncharacterized membrane protein
MSTAPTARPAADPRPPTPGSTMGGIVERNIGALVERRHAEAAARNRQDRVADAISRVTGSMTFVYLHLVVFGLWIVVNLGWIPGLPRFDESFVVLAMVASVESIFVSTFVLITQNRMAALADRRADLDLQVSLLSEHEITRLITLTTAMAAHMGLEEAHAPELDELSRDVAPEHVLDEIERTEKRLAPGSADRKLGA